MWEVGSGKWRVVKIRHNRNKGRVESGSDRSGVWVVRVGSVGRGRVHGTWINKCIYQRLC